MAMLKVENISKRFGGVVAVDNFSLELEKNHTVGIIGPNGAGKTTIFNLISGICDVDSGKVTFEDKDLTNKGQEKVAQSGIARTFQNIRLFKGLNVLDNVKAASDYNARYNFLEALLKIGRARTEEKRIEKEAWEYLKLVKLDKYAKENPENLSYGLQRRLEIARALALKPKVLLLDEPAAGLNPEEVFGLIDFIKELKSMLGISIIVIEHRMDVIMELCQFIYVMDFGINIAKGTPEEIQTNEVVLAAYLGEEKIC